MAHYPNINKLDIPPTDRIQFPEPLGYLNRFFGSDKKPGLLVGGSYFLTGEQNAGKTTLMLQMADALASIGHRVLIDSTEQIISEINDKRNDLSLKYDFYVRASDSDDTCEDAMHIIQSKTKTLFSRDMELMVAAHRQAQDLDFERTGNEYQDERRVVVFIDSLQSLYAQCGEGSMVDLALRFVKLAQKDKMIVFLIGQSTKNGDAAGSNKIPHYVTAHCHMTVESNEKGNQMRKAHMDKNRAGSANTFVSMLTETGHHYFSDGEVADDSDSEKDDGDEE